MKFQGKISRGDASAFLRSVSVETIQVKSESFIFADIGVEFQSLSAMADL